MEELVAPESRTKLIEQLRRLEYGKPERFESIHVRKDGSLFALCIEATPVRDARGRIRWSAMRVLEDVGRWPWNRSDVAAVIEEIHLAGAKVIALDILLSEDEGLRPLVQPDGSVR